MYWSSPNWDSKILHFTTPRDENDCPSTDYRYNTDSRSDENQLVHIFAALAEYVGSTSYRDITRFDCHYHGREPKHGCILTRYILAKSTE